MKQETDELSCYLIKIATGFDIMQTQCIRSYLEAYAVPVFLSNANFVQTSVADTVAVGGIEIWVPRQFARRACELLDAQDKPATEKTCIRQIMLCVVIMYILLSCSFLISGLSLPARGFFRVNGAIICKLSEE